MRPLLIAATLIWAAPGAAATLRPVVTIEAATVRLSDLFDDLGRAGERVIGPAPAPGSRIVVEAAQLAAIARQFAVDWRPVSSADRAVLDRPGRVLARDIVLAALRTALVGVGAGSDLDIDIAGFTAPMVPPAVNVEATVEQLDWDGATGRFTGQLAIVSEGTTPQRLRLSGTAQEMLLVPVPVRRLNAGSVIGPDDLHPARVRAGIARGEVVREAAQAIGQTLRRQATPGQPIGLGDLTRTAAIQKGARVTMRLRAAGLVVVATGQALDAGALGDRIRILNTTSRAVVEAEVTGQDEVRILPGTQPLVAPGNRVAQLATPIGIVP